MQVKEGRKERERLEKFYENKGMKIVFLEIVIDRCVEIEVKHREGII